MQHQAQAPKAPESYQTFWEPIVVDPPPAAAPPAGPQPTKDAYQEFVNLSEEAPNALSIVQS